MYIPANETFVDPSQLPTDADRIGILAVDLDASGRKDKPLSLSGLIARTAASLTIASINGLQSALSSLQSAIESKQPLDPDLTSIASLTPTNGAFLKGSGSGYTIAALSATDIPNLDAGKITSGTFADNQIPASIARDSEVQTLINGKQDTLSFESPLEYNATFDRVSIDPASLAAQTADSVAITGGSIAANLSFLNTAPISFNDQPITRSAILPITDATTARTLTNSDNGAWIVFSSASAITLTIPNGLVTGFNCTIVQGGFGQITFAGAATLLRDPDQTGHTKTKGQNARVSLVYRSANTYDLMGATAA